ncbi:MAG: helix-turn-helix transcriptional regulator [Deltaproteobacteria bacterium]|nr:helix-turn-helix transcriptional regulator [Deltaproteobacteria bacterium]
MKRENKSALEILQKRYIEGDPERKIELQEERVNAEVARLIYDLRKTAGLSQKELAESVGTTQSVISRLEDSDYEGHSFSMLDRIAKALNKRIKVSYVPEDPKV